MNKLTSRIDGWLLLLLFVLGIWWLLAGQTGTPAEEIEVLSASTRPADWVEALGSDDRIIRNYARSNILEVLPGDALESIAIEIFGNENPEAGVSGLWLLAHVDIPDRAEIAAQYLDHGNAEIRRSALTVLIEDPYPEAHDIICELTKDPDRLVQAEALRALAVIAKPEDLPIFLSYLSNTSAQVRHAAHEAIISMAEYTPGTISTLFGVAYGPNAAGVRQALVIIGEIGNPEALDGLFNYLENGSVAFISDAANAIAAIGGDEVRGRALNVYLNGESRQRSQVAKVLGAIGFSDAAPFLWSAVTDPGEEFWLRYNSMDALATCGSESMVEGIIDFLAEGDHDPRLVRTGIETLGGIGGDRVIELYDLIIAGDVDFGLNRQGGNPALLSVINGLGKNDNDEYRERLRELARTSDRENYEILIAITKSLGSIGVPEDIDLLIELEDGRPVMKGFVELALESIRERYPE